MLYATRQEDEGGIRVLIVAENVAFSKAAVKFLRRRGGLVVVGALQGHERALTRAQVLRPRLILFDLDASGHVGLQTISRLCKSMPDVAIIVLSSLESEGYRRAVLAAGAGDLVLKTSLTTDLVPAIECLIQGNGPCQ
jgi:DNA-binding NarL/FixJ family response regulator